MNGNGLVFFSRKALAAVQIKKQMFN